MMYLWEPVSKQCLLILLGTKDGSGQTSAPMIHFAAMTYPVQQQEDGNFARP